MPLLFSLCIFFTLFLFQIFSRQKKRWGVQRFFRTFPFKKISIFFFWGSVFVAALYYCWIVYEQYIAWRDGGIPLQFLVPPFQSISYVFGYHFERLGLFYFISLIVALLFLWASTHFNKKRHFTLFETEEPYVGALAIFLLGNPIWRYAWVIYLVLMLLLPTLFSFMRSIFSKERDRLPLFYFWLPVAFFVILIMYAYPHLFFAV